MNYGKILAQITVVESSACHLCEAASEALARLAKRYPIDVLTLDSSSDDGRHLLEAHRSPMSPLILVDGKLFSWGRLSERKLSKLLEARMTRPPTD